MRPTYTVDLQDSLELAARKLRENGCGVVPVTENETYSGVVTEGSLAGALVSGLELTDSVGRVSVAALTAKPGMTGAEALRLFENQGSSCLIVIDDSGRVLGIVTPSDLYPKRAVPPRPALVGGMATPFGVYLTTGSIRAGVGHFALMTTGMTLFGLFLVASICADLLAVWLSRQGVTNEAALSVADGLPFILVLAGMRFIPLSGIHAAEHKVVHAIERGEELVPSTVRRMPRVHPRCGTNLVVGASLFMGIGTASFIPSPLLRLFCAAIVTLALWRPLGNTMQFYVTTKRPSDKQLAMGIRAGRELLEKYAMEGTPNAGILRRIVCSGMLHVIAGSLVAVALTNLVAYLLHLHLPVSVSFDN